MDDMVERRTSWLNKKSLFCGRRNCALSLWLVQNYSTVAGTYSLAAASTVAPTIHHTHQYAGTVEANRPGKGNAKTNG